MEVQPPQGIDGVFLAKFCRAREATCHKAKPHHEGAVIFSPAAFYKYKKELFRGYSEENHYVLNSKGLLYALLDAGYSTELLLKWRRVSADRLRASPLVSYQS